MTFHIETEALEWGCCNTLKLTDIQRATQGFWSAFNALSFQVPNFLARIFFFFFGGVAFKTFESLRLQRIADFFLPCSIPWVCFYQVHTSVKSRTNNRMALETERQKLQRGLSKKLIGNGGAKHDREVQLISLLWKRCSLLSFWGRKKENNLSPLYTAVSYVAAMRACSWGLAHFSYFIFN